MERTAARRSTSRHLRRWAVVALGLVIAAVAALSSGLAGPATSGAAAGAAKVKPSPTKPLIVGYIDKGSEASYHLSQPFPVTSTAEVAAYPTALSAIVVNVSWAQLEPTKGHVDFTPLDQSLAAVSAYNATGGHNQLTVKLRVWGGYTAPDWAKTLDGPALTVAGTVHQPAGGTLGRWWLADYQKQWTKLQTALAQRYDTNPLLAEVAVSSCATMTDEPFVMGTAQIAAALPAGWTSAQQQQCLSGALGQYAKWKHTAVDFTFNSFSDVSAAGRQSPDPAFTYSVMAACAASSPAAHQPLCILDNHGLTDSILAKQAPLYAEIDSLWSAHPGTPVTFQTLSPNGFNLCTATGIAVAEHARSVEIWPRGPGFAGYSIYSDAQLTAWGSALAGGAAPSCT